MNHESEDERIARLLAEAKALLAELGPPAYTDELDADAAIATLYVRLRVMPDATLEVDIAAQPADAELRERLNGWIEETSIVTTAYRQRKDSEAARQLAEALPRRLRTELRPLLRGRHGGSRTYTSKSANAQHGLSDEGLIEFYVTCEELKQKHGARTAREQAATIVGIPRAYGGKAREDALRRLERVGRKLLEDL